MLLFRPWIWRWFLLRTIKAATDVQLPCHHHLRARKPMVFPDFPSENMAFFTVLNPEMVVSSGFFGVETDRCCSQWMAKANTKKNKPSKMGMQSAKTRWSIENYRSLIAWIWNCHLWVFQISLSTEEWISLGFGNLGHRKFFPWLRFRTVSPLPLITLGYWLGVFRIRKSTWMRQPGWARGPSSSRKGITNTKKITSTYRMHPMFDSKKIKSNSKKKGVLVEIPLKRWDIGNSNLFGYWDIPSGNSIWGYWEGSKISWIIPVARLLAKTHWRKQHRTAMARLRRSCMFCKPQSFQLTIFLSQIGGCKQQ